MNNYNKYIKYKIKYHALRNTLTNSQTPNYNVVERDEKSFNFFTKNVLQYGGALPKIYDTDIPSKVEKFLLSDDANVAILHAPTGYGKTVSGCRMIAKFVNMMRKKNPTEQITGEILMPYRISVKEMYKYLIELNNVEKESYEYGYAIGNDNNEKKTNDATVQTVGHWLEKYFHKMDKTTKQIIMLDEAHDVSWQTDLVLSILLSNIKKGFPIKLLISSATLDVNKISIKYDIIPVIFSIIEPKLNHNIHFNVRNIDLINNDMIKDETSFYNLMIDNIIKAYDMTKSGHILVLMPGQQEITKLINVLIKSNKIKSSDLILPLYSSLDECENNLALEDNINRKIIVSTNMIENAITINNLVATIDSCLRRIVFINVDNINELKLVIASRSNIIQTYGRSGRQGIKGEAFIILSKAQYDALPLFSLNEVERNPVYHQLIKIFKHNLSYIELLKHVPDEKLQLNIKYLVDNNIINKIIKEGEEAFILTDIGEIISKLPCSFQTGIFIANCMQIDKEIPPKQVSTYYNYIALISAWVDSKSSIFARLTKKYNETNEEFELRKIDIKAMQTEFLMGDSLKTFLNVWMASRTTSNLYQWCIENGIFYKNMVDIERLQRDIIRSLNNNFGIKVPSYIRKFDTIDHIIDMLLPKLITSFNKFKLDYYRKERGQAQYKDSNGIIYILDKNIMTTTDMERPPSGMIIGLTLFIKGKLIFVRNTINIPI